MRESIGVRKSSAVELTSLQTGNTAMLLGLMFVQSLPLIVLQHMAHCLSRNQRSSAVIAMHCGCCTHRRPSISTVVRTPSPHLCEHCCSDSQPTGHDSSAAPTPLPANTKHVSVPALTREGAGAVGVQKTAAGLGVGGHQREIETGSLTGAEATQRQCTGTCNSGGPLQISGTPRVYPCPLLMAWGQQTSCAAEKPSKRQY